MMDLSSFTPGSALVTVVLIALAPFFAVMVTSFTKIVVVLSLLRNALGLQQVPPNVVLNGLALILTAYVMNPTLTEMARESGFTQGGSVEAVAYDDGSSALGDDAAPGAAGTRDILSTADRAKEPLRRFLLKHSDARERAFFRDTQVRIARAQGGAAAAPVAETDFIVLIPAFVVRELTIAFQIGFLLFLPFLVIDLVISNILMALGMMMLSPVTVSLPFKLLLFVLVDGWVKISHGLVMGYAP